MKRLRSQILKRKKPEGQKADADGKVKKGHLKAETPRKGKLNLSQALPESGKLADIPGGGCIPKKPFVRGSI